MNFQQNLTLMRENFKSKVPNPSDQLKGKPFWVNNHELNNQYQDQHYLLKNGEVYYAALVQANSALFRWGMSNYGAVIIIGTDKTFENNPLPLLDAAYGIYDLKNSVNAPKEVAAFVDIITDERRYVFNLPIPKEVVNGCDVLFTTLIIDRHHLPKSKIVNGFFPVLAAPDKVKTCMVLPKRFWSEDILNLFLGKLNPGQLL